MTEQPTIPCAECGGHRDSTFHLGLASYQGHRYVADIDAAVEAGALAYVRWINPPHSMRQPTETDRNRVRAVLMASLPALRFLT